MITDILQWIQHPYLGFDLSNLHLTSSSCPFRWMVLGCSFICMARIMLSGAFMLRTIVGRFITTIWLGCQTQVTKVLGKICCSTKEKFVVARNDHNSLGERSKLSELKVQQYVHQVSEHWNGGVFRRIWCGCAKAIMYICYMQLNYPQIHTNVVEVAL